MTQNKILITDRTREQLREFDLNWDVEKRKLFFRDYGIPQTTPFLTTVRTDNQKPLGVVSSRYEPKQNGEILQLINNAAGEHSLTVEKAGYFKDGGKIYFFLRIPENIQIAGDELHRYLIAFSSHDGSSSLSFGLSNTVLSCDNQFAFYHRKKSKFRVRHTQSIHDQAFLLQEKIGAVLLKQENLYSIFLRFAKEDIDQKFVRSTINHVLDLESYLDKNDELSTRKRNQIYALEDSIETEIDEKGSNLWGLFNGITQYANHKKSYPQRPNGRLESIAVGGAHQLMSKGFKFIVNERSLN